MSYVLNPGSGGGDTYTLKAAQDGSNVDIQLDAATGADSEVKLKAGTNITLTEASDTVTIDSAGAGGSIGVNQVAFGDPLNAGDIKGSNNFTFVDESGAVGADVKISGGRPTFTLEDDTGATDYKSIFRQSGASGYWYHADSTGTDRQMIRVAAADIIINESGDDVDVRIEGDTEDNLFRTSATQDNIGIGGQPGANVQRLHVVGDSNNTSLTDAVVKIQNTVSGQTFTALELSNENDDSGSDVTMRMRSNSGTDSDFEIVHDSFGGTTLLTNQPNTGTVAQMKISPDNLMINPNQQNVDFYVNAAGNFGLISADAGNNEVGIGGAPVSGQGILQVNGDANFKNLIKLNNQAGTTGQVLTSQGPSADPIWASAGGGGAAGERTKNAGYLTSDIAADSGYTGVSNWNLNINGTGTATGTPMAGISTSDALMFPFIVPVVPVDTQMKATLRTGSSAGGDVALGFYASDADGMPNGSPFFSTVFTPASFTTYTFNTGQLLSKGALIWFTIFGQSSATTFNVSPNSNGMFNYLPFLSASISNNAKPRSALKVAMSGANTFDSLSQSTVYDTTQVTTLIRLAMTF